MIPCVFTRKSSSLVLVDLSTCKQFCISLLKVIYFPFYSLNFPSQLEWEAGSNGRWSEVIDSLSLLLHLHIKQCMHLSTLWGSGFMVIFSVGWDSAFILNIYEGIINTILHVSAKLLMKLTLHFSLEDLNSNPFMFPCTSRKNHLWILLRPPFLS